MWMEEKEIQGATARQWTISRRRLNRGAVQTAKGKCRKSFKNVPVRQPETCHEYRRIYVDGVDSTPIAPPDVTFTIVDRYYRSSSQTCFFPLQYSTRQRFHTKVH